MMTRFAEPPCGDDTFLQVLKEMLEGSGSDYIKLYQNADKMADAALWVRKRSASSYCLLPFCHTLEAEGYGADIQTGNALSVSRPQKARFLTLNELIDGLPSLDLTTVRIRETLKACHLLRAYGENVLFQVSGPLTILDCLIPSEVLLRSLLKQPEQLFTILNRIGKDLLELMRLAEAAGAGILSFSDPIGAPSLLGPRLSGMVARKFTLPFLREADHLLDRSTLFLLCPKTALSLTSSGLASWKIHLFNEAIPYSEAALQLRGDIRFGGSSCPKLQYPSTEFHELILKETT